MTIAEARKLMPPCPICGDKAYLIKDKFENYDMGYEGGCPSFRLYDGKHKIYDMYDPKVPRVHSSTVNVVLENWTKYCEYMSSGKDMSYREPPSKRREKFKLVIPDKE